MTGCSSRRPRRASAEGGTEMTHYAGIDVSLETSSICVVDGSGAVLRELKVESEPEALAAALMGTGLEFTRVGLEAGPMSQWLHAGLRTAGLPVLLLETRRAPPGSGAYTPRLPVPRRPGRHGRCRRAVQLGHSARPCDLLALRRGCAHGLHNLMNALPPRSRIVACRNRLWASGEGKGSPPRCRTES
jgi:hypothetical protein